MAKKQEDINQKALRFLQKQIPEKQTGSVTLHFHQGVIRKLDWRHIDNVDSLPKESS